MSVGVMAGRLDVVRRLGLSAGVHVGPSGDEEPSGCSILEAVAHVTRQPWSNTPRVFSSSVEAFLERFNDDAGDADRQVVGAWVFDNLQRLAATADYDGGETARGYALMDYGIRVSLPGWLAMAGAKDAAERLRSLAPITDRRTAELGCEAVWSAVCALPLASKTRDRLERIVWTEVSARLKGGVVEVVADADGVVAELVTEVAELAVDAAVTAVVQSADVAATYARKYFTAPAERAEVYAKYLAELSTVAAGVTEVSDAGVSAATTASCTMTRQELAAASEALKTALRVQLGTLLHEQRTQHGVKTPGEAAIEALEHMLGCTTEV